MLEENRVKGEKEKVEENHAVNLVEENVEPDEDVKQFY